jgi:hypothetical protein
VVLDLSTIVQAVIDRLDERGLTFVENIPTDAISGQIVLFQSQALANAQAGVELLNTLSWVLLVVALACYGGSILLLGDGRRGFLRVGVGLATGGLLLGVMLATGRGLYLDAAVDLGGDRTVQSIVFDHVFASLRNALRTVVALGLVIGVVAWVLGPSRPATWVRSLFASGLGKGAQGAGAIGVGDQAALRWLGRRERIVQGIVLALAGALFLFWTQPTPRVVLGVAIVTVLLLAVVSVLARAGRAASPEHDGDVQPRDGEDEVSVGATASSVEFAAGAAAPDAEASDPADDGPA